MGLRRRDLDKARYTVPGALHQISAQGWPVVISLMMPVLLSLTVVASVSFGVLAAYALVLGILAVFGHSDKPEPARRRLVLIPTENQASGD